MGRNLKSASYGPLNSISIKRGRFTHCSEILLVERWPLDSDFNIVPDFCLTRKTAH